MTDNKQAQPIQVPTNWGDFGHRVWRAFYIGASAALPASVGSDLLSDGIDVSALKHICIAVVVAGLNAVFTAIKAGIAQGRGSDPTNGALK